MEKELKEFPRNGRGGYRADCKECRRQADKKWREENKEIKQECSRRYYRNNKEKMQQQNKKWREENRNKKRAYDQKRRAKARGLYNEDSLDWESILFNDFGGKCALTGDAGDVTMEHFIPVYTGHGGTYRGNVYPVSGKINASKWRNNPFEWRNREDVSRFICPRRWDALVEYLAGLHGLTVDEFREFVYWCFENPRSPEQAAKDTAAGLTSLDIWRASKKLRTAL